MGIWASAGSRAWCPIVRAPAAELAPEQGPDRSWPQRPEAAWPGPPARCGSPRIEPGPRRSGACAGPTFAGRTVQRGAGHPQRVEHFRTNRSILGRGGLGAAATERWPAPGPAARAGGSTRSGRRARPASCPCPSSKPSRSACHLLGDRLAFCHLKTHRTPPPGPAGPRGASVLRGHLHMRQSIAFEDFSGEATRPATSRPCSKGYHDARPHFDAFPPSTRRAILEWIDAAKCPATRAARIVETAPEGERRHPRQQVAERSRGRPAVAHAPSIMLRSRRLRGAGPPVAARPDAVLTDQPDQAVVTTSWGAVPAAPSFVA